MPKHVTITNYDKGSQLFIPTSEWTDSGIYTITVKNMVGQDSISIEVKVTGNCSCQPQLWDTYTNSLKHPYFRIKINKLALSHQSLPLSL